MAKVYHLKPGAEAGEVVAEFDDRHDAETFIETEIKNFQHSGHNPENGTWWARKNQSPPNHNFWIE